MVKHANNIFEMTANSARRARRFRCLSCQRLVSDGDAIVVERATPRRARAWHVECLVSWAVLSRSALIGRGWSPSSSAMDRIEAWDREFPDNATQWPAAAAQ